MIKVIIEDLQVGKSSDYQLERQNEASKALFAQQCRLMAMKPRDPSVWSKQVCDEIALKKAKQQWKKEMRSKYPSFTNKSGFYTQKALIWS